MPDAEVTSSIPMGRRRTTFKIVLVGAVLVASVLPCELLVRVLAPQPESWLDIYRRHPIIDAYSLQPNARRQLETDGNRWTVLTDAEGFRVSEPGAVERNALVVLGDSFAFGYGVNAADSFVGLLDAARIGGRRVINTGVPGYGPIQYRQTLEGLLGSGYAPSAVIVATFLGNDFHDCIWKAESDVVDGILGNRGDLASLIKRRSHLCRLVARGYRAVVPRPRDAFTFRETMYVDANWSADPLAPALRRYREEFATMARLCADRKIPLLVAILPIREALEPAKPGQDPRLPATKALQVLAELNIRVVDLTTGLEERPTSETYFKLDGHFAPAGHRIAFDVLREALSGTALHD